MGGGMGQLRPCKWGEPFFVKHFSRHIASSCKWPGNHPAKLFMEEDVLQDTTHYYWLRVSCSKDTYLKSSCNATCLSSIAWQIPLYDCMLPWSNYWSYNVTQAAGINTYIHTVTPGIIMAVRFLKGTCFCFCKIHIELFQPPIFTNWLQNLCNFHPSVRWCHSIVPLVKHLNKAILLLWPASSYSSQISPSHSYSYPKFFPLVWYFSCNILTQVQDVRLAKLFKIWR